MNTKEFRYYSFILLISFIGFSCRKEIPVDVPNSQPKIVISSIIEKDENISANLFISSNAIDEHETSNFLNNASVFVYENNILVDTMEFFGDGNYRSADVIGELGNEYKLIVAATNFDTIIGKTTLVDFVSINSFDTVRRGKDMNGFLIMYCDVKFSDPSAEKNYYRLKIIDNPEKDFNIVYSQSNDPIIEYAHWNGIYYFTDALFQGKEYSFSIQLDNYYSANSDEEETQYSNNVYVILENMSEDYYYFSKSVSAQYDVDGFGFFAQAVIVYNNIENGFGIVGSKGISTKPLGEN
ncbi:MAG: DUF4249 domain-containing protein [Salinivirgaceae bacterium]|nr:DUF4249 domain-containing protein [Salinivirgaceae bacterium]